MNHLTYQSILLGILQGLTEFLPISSSAHLLVLPWLMQWEPMGLTFDVMLHAGTLLALISYFRADLKQLIRELWERVSNSEAREGQGRVLLALGAGTIPAVILGGLFHGVIERELRTPIVTVLTLSGFGLLLWWAGRNSRGARNWDSLDMRDGLIVGLSQSMALVPGVSRSGITITAALLLGFSRVDSARFSFLLAVPIIGMTTLAKSYELTVASPATLVAITPLAVGVLCSFLSGFLCIKYFLRFLVKRSFFAFACYRLLLAAVILWRLVL